MWLSRLFRWSVAAVVVFIYAAVLTHAFAAPIAPPARPAFSGARYSPAPSRPVRPHAPPRRSESEPLPPLTPVVIPNLPARKCDPAKDKECKK